VTSTDVLQGLVKELNDLEMMDAATYSFAMANAHPLLKQRASWVAPANSANGVVRAIRTVLAA
jgi:hydroxymethylpyrimidine pyrophosphatase-like HAD family hydrolase